MFFPHRRQFLQLSGAAGLATWAPRLLADPLGVPVGIQLYTVSAALQKDLPGTLKRLREIGYRNIESFAYPGRPPVKELRAAFDEAGLKCRSAHLHFNQVDLAPLFEEAHVLGATYAASSTLLPDNYKRPANAGKNANETLTLDDFHGVAERMNKVAAAAKSEGLQYAYHNHNFEFRDQGDGQIGYDVLLKNTDPGLVKFEIDCGWMILAGYNPVEYMRNYPGRFRMLHIKDFVPGPEKSTSTAVDRRPGGTELGRGRVDYKPIFAAAKRNQIEYYFVEQEPPFPEGVTPLEAAEIDYKYLHAL